MPLLEKLKLFERTSMLIYMHTRLYMHLLRIPETQYAEGQAGGLCINSLGLQATCPVIHGCPMVFPDNVASVFLVHPRPKSSPFPTQVNKDPSQRRPNCCSRSGSRSVQILFFA